MSLIDNEISINLQLIDELGYKDTLNLSVTQVARIIGVSTPTVEAWRKRGFIEAIKVGNRVLYPKLKIAEFQARKNLDLLEEAIEDDAEKA